MIDLLNKHPQEVPLAAADAEYLFKNMTTMDEIREGRMPHEQTPRQDHPKGIKHLLGQLQNRMAQSTENIAALIESQVQERTADLSRKAHYDALTHLPNRAYFQDILETLVQRHRETGENFTLLFLDLDGFKKVNDILGHHIGDELLRHVSARLVSSVREWDIVSRLGGDEFIVLLADTDQQELIENISQRIIQETARPFWFDEIEVKTSCSIGIAIFPTDATTATELLENADTALYASKEAGKKMFQFFEPKLSQKSPAETVLQNQFNSDLKGNHFQLIGEPQYDLKQNKASGIYITAQWTNSPMAEHNLPNWLNLLKKSQWEYSMGLWLVDSSFYYLNQWQQHHPEWVVTVPILEALWRSDDFLILLKKHAQNYQISHNQIQLEFTLKEFEIYDLYFCKMLKKLNQSGFQITLSGVGQEPLDLNLLAGLSIQEFKLAPNWIQKNLASKTGKQWIKATIQMATNSSQSPCQNGL